MRVTEGREKEKGCWLLTGGVYSGGSSGSSTRSTYDVNRHNGRHRTSDKTKFPRIMFVKHLSPEEAGA